MFRFRYESYSTEGNEEIDNLGSGDNKGSLRIKRTFQIK
jgi:hypothetical protein